MTNAPVVLTQDCDMYATDPSAPRQTMCYLADVDPAADADRIGYVQFPQRFTGTDQHDIYACEHKRLYQINPAGMDGLAGPSYVGSNCFFRRQSFFKPPPLDPPSPSAGRPSSLRTQSVLELAHNVAHCNYELGTSWGCEVHFCY